MSGCRVQTTLIAAYLSTYDTMNGLVVFEVDFLSLVAHPLMSNARDLVDPRLTDVLPPTCSMSACPLMQYVESCTHALIDTCNISSVSCACKRL